MNILFLGNSLVFYNDMPELFRCLAQSGKKTVSVSSVTKGAATMSDFADPNTEVGKRAALLWQENKWDHIIIEPSRRITPYESSVYCAEENAAKKLMQHASKAGAQLHLYAVWGNNSGNLKVFAAQTPTQITAGDKKPISRREHTRFMHETAHRISDALGGVSVAEAGYAFENMLAAHADTELYHADLRHPSPVGSYLAACVFYARIFREKTEGLTFTAGLSEAAKCQRIADLTVLHGMTPTLPAFRRI